VKSPSHVSSSASNKSRQQRIEMGRDVIPRGSSVIVVNDVLATGETFCAVLQLLSEAGIAAEDVTVMVVAEFPFHRGRQLLYQHGSGGVKIQSLLVLEVLKASQYWSNPWKSSR
jgi:adenine/guanine phosphoribosyltransferase-like PRPP-binding protein